MLRWMRYLWIVSRQFTAKVFAHRLVLMQKLVMVSFQSEITEVPAGCSGGTTQHSHSENGDVSNRVFPHEIL